MVESRMYGTPTFCSCKPSGCEKLPCIDQIFGYLSDKNFIQAILKGSVLVYSHSAATANAKNDTTHKNITDNYMFDFYSSDKSGLLG